MDGTKTTSSLCFLYSSAELLFPSAAVFFTAVVVFFLSAGLFPIAVVTQRGEGFVREDGGGRRSVMGNCHLACEGRRSGSGGRDR